ncbi:hypothetical protein [Ruminiclostridium cellobioparum]|jgi:hypothetical protein|uniref:Uncharacterized protein n=1 Tax=Ruminiclostridium cellobioparum subsp. termitidis CT1112 TaxID=1195236 RepID=S0FJG0_RUMCE|nr:hypothetical protein [Ruminiclostridium cellobioparum]EMS69259.1 hypothetical protein CTER_5092 [Ruminiclostridium cellobioparum subsp. termitidis CT1112]
MQPNSVLVHTVKKHRQPKANVLFGKKTQRNLMVIEETPVIHLKERKKPLRKKGDREKLTANLTRETIECILNLEEALCISVKMK